MTSVAGSDKIRNIVSETETPSHQSSAYERLLPVFLLVLLAVPLFGWGSATIPLMGPDEPRYAAIANEMLKTGDYITPRLGGQPWFEKPAMTYWAMAASYRLFGVDEFAARFPSILLALWAVLAVFYTGRRLSSARVGLFAALALEASVGFIAFSRAAATDMILTATLTFALCAFLLSEEDSDKPTSITDKRSFWLTLFYLSIGLTVLAKGLAGVALGGGIIGSYLLISRRLRKFIGFHIIWGGILVLAVCSIWYGPVIARNGYRFIDEFFIQHHFQRFTSNKYHHPGPFYYYFVAILLAAFPFSFLLPVSVARFRIGEYLKGKIDNENRWRLFALLWMLFPTIFFSFSGSKLPSYILPAVPGAALLLACDLEDIWRNLAARAQWIGLSLSAFFMIGGGFALPFLTKINVTFPMRLSLAIVLLAAGLTICISAFRRSHIAIIGSIALPVILVPILTVAVSPQLAEHDSVKPLAIIARNDRRPGEAIVFSGDLPRIVHGFTFYTDSQVTYDEDKHGLTLDEVTKETIDTGHLLCVTNETEASLLSANNQMQVEVLGRQRGIVLMRLTATSSQ